MVAFGASNIGLPFPNIVLGDVEQGSVAERVVVSFKQKVSIPPLPRRVLVKVHQKPVKLVLWNSDNKMAVRVAVFGADVGGDVGASAASKLLDEGPHFPLVLANVGEVRAGQRDHRGTNPRRLLLFWKKDYHRSK